MNLGPIIMTYLAATDSLRVIPLALQRWQQHMQQRSMQRLISDPTFDHTQRSRTARIIAASSTIDGNTTMRFNLLLRCKASLPDLRSDVHHDWYVAVMLSAMNCMGGLDSTSPRPNTQMAATA